MAQKKKKTAPRRRRPKFVRFNVMIPESLRDALYQRQEETGASMGEITRRALREYLGQSDTRHPPRIA